MLAVRSTRIALVATAAALALACGGSSSSSSTPTVPAAPSGVVATPGNAQVTLSWTAVSGATSYDVYWSTSPGVTKSTGTKIPGVTSPYVHSGLANGTTYYYVVTALNAAGESAASTAASATPAANPPPAAPTGVVATAGNHSVTLTWTAVANATSYDVYYATTSGVGPTTGTQVAGVASPATVTGLVNGTPYYFVVTALNANGESTASAEVTATPAAAAYVQAMVLTVSGGGTTPFGFLDQVQVCTDASCVTPVTGATVTVNGTPLTYDSGQQRYLGNVQVALGAQVTLSVTSDGTTVTATGPQYTAAPSVTSPVTGAMWMASAANVVSWSGGAPTTGSSYVAGVLDGSGNFVFPAGNHGPQELPIGTTSWTVPANTLAPGTYTVLVGIGTTGIVHQTSGGIAVPGALAGSGLWLGAVAPFPTVTVQ